MIFQPNVYHDIAEEMVRNDSDRDMLFDKSDKLYHNEWELPKEWEKLGWVRKFVSTKPADAIDLAIRSLSTREPDLNLAPLLNNKETKAAFNRMERGLKWAYRQLSRRGQSNPTKDIISSALRYDAIAVNLVYLPYQNKALEALTGKRKAVAEQNGKWALIVHNPRNVHVQYSDYGVERLVLRKYQKIADIVAFWGKSAEKINAWVKENPSASLTDYAYVYDYWDAEVRYVWMEGGGNVNNGNKVDILPPSMHELGFIPWSCRVGGSSLDVEPDKRHRPLHATIMASDQWDTANMFKSMMMSLAMARAAVPPATSVTPTGEGVEIDATEPIGQVKLKPGESYSYLPPAGIDPIVGQMYQMVTNEMNDAAGVELMNVAANAGQMAFATFTAAMQSAMTTVEPSKFLAEKVLADVFSLMASWLRKTGDVLEFYQDDKRGNYGEQEIVEADEFPLPQDFYATVKLTPYIPSDQMQKINAMQILTNNMAFPNSRALEQLDVSDPEIAFEEWTQEQLDKAAVQEQIKQMQFEAEMERQQLMMQLQAQMQQQQMAAQAGGPPPGAPGSQLPADGQMAQAPFAALGGDGFNPNMGGQSPVAGAPGMLREQLSGQAMVQSEGRDNRGLRLPPEGRESRR